MRRFLAGFSLLVLLLAPQAVVAAAPFNPLDGACQAGDTAQNSPSCAKNNSTTPLTGPNGTLNKVTNVIAIVAGIAAVIVVIISGLQYITSGGDPQRTSSARSTLTYALIGLIVIGLAKVIITFIISKV